MSPRRYNPLALRKLERARNKLPAVATLALVCALLLFSATLRGVVYPLALAAAGVLVARKLRGEDSGSPAAR